MDLVQDHPTLKEALERCAAAVASSDEGALRQAEALGALMGDHFKRKEALYQQLGQMCLERGRPRELGVINLLAQNMSVVSDRVLSFFAGLQRGRQMQEAAHGFRVVADAVRVRLDTEEKMLVPLYARVLRGASPSPLEVAR